MDAIQHIKQLKTVIQSDQFLSSNDQTSSPTSLISTNRRRSTSRPATSSTGGPSSCLVGCQLRSLRLSSDLSFFDKLVKFIQSLFGQHAVTDFGPGNDAVQHSSRQHMSWLHSLLLLSLHDKVGIFQ